jgi:serine/threonine protein kinase/tetratricopeptide (TPR) repeat protein
VHAPGDLIADRFEIQALAGTGGMGDVHRAIDRVTGETVALKVLHSVGARGAQRFAREAVALAALRHPAIARYVAHGKTAEGVPWIAMEWLEGETLGGRLARRRLSPAEGLALAARVASALGAVHRRGFIHRDVKPGNIFLPGGAASGAVLLDFGIARVPDAAHELTEAGAMLGTPGFVAPEQARGERVDARADVFALGCVLFKAFAGRAAFLGDDRLGVLLKVVLESPPRLREIDPEIPAPIEELVARMLAKAPAGRPRDGDALAAEIAAITAAPGASPVFEDELGGDGPPSSITAAERRVMCLLLTRDASLADEITLSSGDSAARRHALLETVERHHGQIELLADRSMFVVLNGEGAPTDLAGKAARCALSVQALLGGAPMAVVTGRGEVSSRIPVGALIDRAVGLLAHQRYEGPRPLLVRRDIRIDEVTASLVGARFDVGRDEGGLYLRGERDALEVKRTLLGKPTSCVGREVELGLLEAIFVRCAEESRAAAVLVTGAAGMGKSRLCTELILRLRERDDPIEIWIARGDPMRAGSPFGMLAQALERAMGIRETEPPEARRRKIRARVTRGKKGERRPEGEERVAEFLGELLGAPFPDEDAVQLRAARRDPVLMGDQMRRAFEDFVEAETAARPLLLVLEDLHWGDLPTVSFVDAALRSRRDRPLMVLAVARPEVHDLFPRLWEGRAVQQVRLAELSRRAGERLVRQALGARTSAETVAALVERAAGNAFYLEELIRAVAEGRGAALPETVLSMVQARIEALDPEARRVLRAASVFGQTFWEDGVSALLGGARVDTLLAALAEGEIVARRREGRFPGEGEFGHALLREAAYAMLTERDRTVGHALAGAWLERAGERDPMVLAEHFDRGGEAARAAAWYRRAAEQAFEGDDLEGALARAARGVQSGAAEGEALGALHELAACAHRWRGENAEALASAEQALPLLPRGSARWCEAAGEAILASGKLGDVDRVTALAEVLLALATADGVGSPSHAIAMTRPAFYLLFAGRHDLHEALLDGAAGYSLGTGDPGVVAQVAAARSARALLEGDVGGYLRFVEASRASSIEAGDLRGAVTRALNVGYAQMQVGAYAEAERALSEGLVEAERMGLKSARPYARHNLGLALARLGRLDEARAAEEEAVAAFRASGDRRLEAASRSYLATILLLGGSLDRAAEEAGAVAGDPRAAPALRACALATLADVRLRERRAPEALEAAREAHAILASLGGLEEGEALIRLVWAEALEAEDAAAARAAIAEARERLLARAAKIADPALRQSFLERVPENALTLLLAERWIAPEP